MAAQTTPNILVTGDSLSAAYGIPLEKGWVALLQQRLIAEGYSYRLVNTSVSGETTAGALARLADELTRYQPEIVIIELGGNDGLRGLSLDELRRNLLQMIALSREAGSKVLLIGMRLPSNYGVTYTEQFHQLYLDIAKETSVALLPFLLADIALDISQFQDDGVHPNAAAQPVLRDSVWPVLEPLIEKTGNDPNR